MTDRYRGAMVGTLCGDASGAPYEWQKSADIRADLVKRGGLVPHKYELFDYIEPWKKKRMVQKGHPTDDSELAAALAMSLIACRGLNEADLYKRLRSFIIDRKSILTTEAYGSGSTLSAALQPPTYEESKAKFALGDIRRPPSNGSLMRCIAIPLAFDGPETTPLIKAAETQSKVTHRNLLSVAACIAYSVFVSFILGGYAPAKAWSFTRLLGWSDSYKEHIAPLAPTQPTEDDIWPPEPHGPGDAITSLRAAVWATIEANDFADGIIKVISLGGDTDTYAAIAGGALGARFGIKGIPPAWVNVLQGREAMIAMADELLELATSK